MLYTHSVPFKIICSQCNKPQGHQSSLWDTFLVFLQGTESLHVHHVACGKSMLCIYIENVSLFICQFKRLYSHIKIALNRD